jgi:hypothetical protein
MYRFSFLFLWVVLAALPLSAQHFVPQTSRINTPYGPANITTNQYQPGYMHYGGYPEKGKKYRFTVALKGDSSVIGLGRLDTRKKPNALVLKNGKQRYYLTPIQTRVISRHHTDGRIIEGKPGLDVWYFAIISGEISGFTTKPESGEEYVSYIRKGSRGPIMPLTKVNLELMMGKELTPEIEKSLKENRLLEALKEYNRLAAIENTEPVN